MTDKSPSESTHNKMLMAVAAMVVGGGAATGGFALGGQPVDMTPIVSRIEKVEQTLSTHGIELARMEEQGKAMRKLLEEEIPKLRESVMVMTKSVNSLELRLSLVWNKFSEGPK